MVDQQFCLRWNNHKSTLISVFDTLLENNVLVDCTLAAEGQYLKAHKVVLCACSPYLERILSQHTERHPILILKDVKYQELKCMMDYMYKGEVNISQEQLETFLKAAESLQIKGLTDSGSKDDYRVANHSKRQEQTRKPPSIQLVSSTSPVSTPYSHSSALNELNVRQTSTSNVDAPLDASPNSRDRSLSPVPRKKKRPRRPSQTDSEHFDSASETPVQIQSTPMINVPLANQILSTSTSSTINDGTDQSLTVADIARFTGVLSTENIKKEKIESQPDNLIVPKTEFLDDVNEDGVEDLTLEEDIENMDGGPGPSHSSENSNQGYGWSIAGERSTDEIFTSQDLANTAQDNQENDGDVENACVKRKHQEQQAVNTTMASMDKVSLQLVTSNTVNTTAATGRLADFLCNGSSSSSAGAQPLFISFCPPDANQASQCAQQGAANSGQAMTTALLKALDSSSLDGNSNIELFYLYNENEPSSDFGTDKRPGQTQLNSFSTQPNVTVFKAEPVPVSLNELMNTSDDNSDLTTLTAGCYAYDASAINGLQSSGTSNGVGAPAQDAGASCEELLAPQVTKKRQRWCLKKPVNECYTCTECSKVYTFKGNLMRHYKFECGKKPQFQCSECSASFHYANYLSCHFKRRHVLTDKKQTIDGAVDAATADGRESHSSQPEQQELQPEDSCYVASDGVANIAETGHPVMDQ